jgi:hypothetical protein
MNATEANQIINSPAATEKQKDLARKYLQEVNSETKDDISPYWSGPTLAELLPDRFPPQTANAYTRIRQFLSSIPLGGLAKEVFADYGITCALDLSALFLENVEQYSKHPDKPKLLALLNAANALAHTEYFVDHAHAESEKSLSFFSLTKLRGADLGDWLHEQLRKAQLKYEAAARLFPPDDAKPILPTRRPLETDERFHQVYGLIAMGAR